MPTENDAAKLVQAGDVLAIWLEEITRKHCDDSDDQAEVKAAIARWREAVSGAKVEESNRPTDISQKDLDTIHRFWMHVDDQDS